MNSLNKKKSVDFSGRVAAISGGGSGIGLSVAHRLVEGGASVCLWDIDENALRRARSEFAESDPVQTDRVDVVNAQDVMKAADALASKLGSIDILVTSAGITGPTVVAWEYPLDDWQRVLRINLDGVMHCCRAVVPHMLRTGYGRIVNISSIAAKEGNPKASAYAASKGGVVAFTKSLGKELVNTEIRANTICPAAIATELLKQMDQKFVDALLAKIPLGRLGRADEVAALIAWMCSEECSFCTGAVFDASGGRATY